MFRILLIACAFQALATFAWAQTEKLPVDLQGLPEEIKTLKWQTIDVRTISPLEHSRALLLMNHVLDELCANVTAEADLMSSYIEKQNLGAQFAGTAPPPAPPQLSYADAEKVAVALLRGPMSQSYYATELGDVSEATLISYVQMYQHTCQRRWSEFDESRHLVRCMGSFLGNSGKLGDYEGWATAESARREEQYQKQANTQGSGPPAAPPSQAQAQQIQQAGGALAAVEAQQQQAQAQQTSQAQQQGSAGQQQAQQASQTQQPGYNNNSGYVYPGGYYGGYGYTYPGTATAGAAGAAAAGAYAGANAEKNQEQQRTAEAAAAGHYQGENAQKQQQQQAAGAHAGAGASQYHASNSSWNRSASYNSTAHSQTEQRMNSFHGTPSYRGGGGERTGGGRR